MIKQFWRWRGNRFLKRWKKFQNDSDLNKYLACLDRETFGTDLFVYGTGPSFFSLILPW